MPTQRRGWPCPYHLFISPNTSLPTFPSSWTKSSAKHLHGVSGAFFPNPRFRWKQLLEKRGMTDLDSILHFARVVFDDESRLHHRWEFNVGVPFMLTLEFVQQRLVCGLRKTEWRKLKGRSCKPNRKTFLLLSWPQKGKQRHSELPLLCLLQQNLLVREGQTSIFKLHGNLQQGDVFHSFTQFKLFYPSISLGEHHCWSFVNETGSRGRNLQGKWWEKTLCPWPRGFEVTSAKSPGLSLPFTWRKLAWTSDGRTAQLQNFHTKAAPEATCSAKNFSRDRQMQPKMQIWAKALIPMKPCGNAAPMFECPHFTLVQLLPLNW